MTPAAPKARAVADVAHALMMMRIWAGGDSGLITMANLRMLDMQVIDDLFQRAGNPGYVLDFSDRTFAIFFAQELNVDIDDPVYAKDGQSKMRRLKCYLRSVHDDAAARALTALWEYREMRRQKE